ncbi:hypothetical protein [Legionella shakespearei]|nr:hypothetical protein [Legionella shakespearei]
MSKTEREHYILANDLLHELFAADPHNPMLHSIKGNLEHVYNWLPSEKALYDPQNKKHVAARQSLEAAVIILQSIKKCNSEYIQTTPDPQNNPLFKNMLQGSHVLIDDNGAFVDAVKSQITLVKRYSSHYKKEKIAELKKDFPDLTPKQLEDKFNHAKPDYSLRAEVVFNELLMGQIQIDEKKYSWLQLEGHSHQPRTVYNSTLLNVLDRMLQWVNYSIEKLGHHMDYLRYRFHGRTMNIGQYGKSSFTESNPLRLDAREATLV